MRRISCTFIRGIRWIREGDWVGWGAGLYLKVRATLGMGEKVK